MWGEPVRFGGEANPQLHTRVRVPRICVCVSPIRVRVSLDAPQGFQKPEGGPSGQNVHQRLVDWLHFTEIHGFH